MESINGAVFEEFCGKVDTLTEVVTDGQVKAREILIDVEYPEVGKVPLPGVAIMFFWTLQRITCSKCVNFSCPLNGVPKPVVDRYLEKNPVMREAWERTGHQLGC
ncbi:MAG: hypothetical protein H8E40_11875 [Chloroflexi bacterium]|nr:hypothetical protein [Chloroflexota bacterium]